ncbi:hypothetical protein ANCCEY_10349 [Ancylostoma ceylanicum]|uniref:Uncharacterized protein n=1 Tax=Ancylostoma ceylanicum TaxID=53326 RepID=A0A0D6LHA4_9BILA|nr:hypothetical protein ANCCEY_10349 [Ancylostoma ceylanicum]
MNNTNGKLGLAKVPEIASDNWRGRATASDNWRVRVTANDNRQVYCSDSERAQCRRDGARMGGHKRLRAIMHDLVENNPRQPTANFDPRQSQPHYNHQQTSQTTTSTTGPSAVSNRGYGPDEDYEDDLLPVVMTTPSVQTQIPYPTQFDPLWPTPAPGQFFHSDPRNPKKAHDQRFTKFGEHASENNIPCSAYTDDICYQQQEKFGREGLSKCCQRGIYLTDARYACCEDDEQSLGPASTNDFSMCCHDNFVNDDECCGKETAANYWRSVHEVCYPNTKVDYSGIKMEVRFAEGVRVVDMNENRVWDYECRNGGNRTQYAYIPQGT